MIYRIANLGTGILGTPAPARKKLGQDAEAIRKARALYDRVVAGYRNLVNLIGKEKADLAVEQAREKIEEAGGSV